MKFRICTQINRSGYAGEAKGRIYSIDEGSSLRKAMDHIVSTANGPAVVNLSMNANEDPTCLGDTNIAQDANDLYEDGILMFVATGNSTNGNVADCNLGSPGAAIGVFSVGAHDDEAAGRNGEASVRTAPLASYSQTGGNEFEGLGRSIVDILGYGYRDFMFDTNGQYSGSVAGTSYATPTVAAAAINFIDWYRNTNGTSIDDNPGRLHANMLLMGDRTSSGGGFLTAQFDYMYGAGRMFARKFDSAGTDAPAGWQTGERCVGDGEIVYIDINGGAALPASVDIFKSVIFWYDRRHEEGTTIDDVDLWVKETNGTFVGASSTFTDEKERVFSSNVAGKTMQIVLYGADVTADAEGCGTNKMKVHYAYFFEDSARNDADGPGAEIQPE